MNAPFRQAEPFDDANQRLVANGHPQDWRNPTFPTPPGRYNLVVVGAGTAGLVAAAGAAGTGAKVALIENELMGGDCLTVGCVPSKGMIAAARLAHDARTGGDFGVHAGDMRIDFAQVMDRVRTKRADLSPIDSAKRFREELGVDVYLGTASFTGRDRVKVTGPHGDAELTFKRACIATGGSPATPKIDGLDAVDYLTNETLYTLVDLPPRLCVLGGGPIGCEMAQTFRRLGSEVTVVDHGDRILSKDDEELAAVVRAQMDRDGVAFRLGAKAERVEQDGETIRVHLGGGEVIDCDKLLVAVGRSPNLDGLGLEAAGVETDKKGVVPNEYLQTSNPDVYAAGDVAGRWQFTHAADATARIVVQNALFFGRKKVTDLVMPWCTYTDPELATTGRTAKQLQKDGVAFETFTVEMAHVDRAVLEGDDAGLLKVYATKKGKILGGTLCCRGAGDMISELTLAITCGAKLGGLSATIHPYPTLAEAFRKAGDGWSKTRLTPLVKGLMTRLHSWRR